MKVEHGSTDVVGGARPCGESKSGRKGFRLIPRMLSRFVDHNLAIAFPLTISDIHDPDPIMTPVILIILKAW